MEYRWKYNRVSGWKSANFFILFSSTVVANTILRYLFPDQHYDDANARFNAMRILEDYFYQSEARQSLIQVLIVINHLDLFGTV